MNKLQLINGEYPLKRTTIFVGNFGSGKSEVSVNFTLKLARAKPAGLPLNIVDLDVVNPYFRCREAVEPLEKEGVRVVYPKGQYAWADLPIILPEIKGLLEDTAGLAVLDVGGDDVGARALGSISDWVNKENAEMLFVLNASRPFTGDSDGAMKIMREVAASAKINIGGIVINSHLVHETSAETIFDGIKLGEDVAKQTGLKIRFVSVMQDILKNMDASKIKYPILDMERQLLPPWEFKGPRLGPKRFKLV